MPPWKIEQPHFNYPPPELVKITIKDRDTGKDKIISFYKTHTGAKAARVSTVIKGKPAPFNTANWARSCGSEILRAQNSTILLDSGTLAHAEMEYFVLNGDFPDWIYWPIRDIGDNIEPALVQNVTNVRGLEQPVSNRDGTIAGTIDMVADWNGVPSIIDYKTSYKKKNDYDNRNYYLQATLYARLWEEMTGQKIEQFVIIMIVVRGNIRWEYVKKTADYQQKLDVNLAKFAEGIQN